MISTKHTPRLAPAVLGLLCLALPAARAAGPAIYGAGTTPGSTLITFSETTVPPAVPLAVLPGDTLSGFGGALAPKPATPLTADLSAKGVPGYNGLPGPPKTDFVPEPSETATLALGGVMLGGLALLARKRRAARAF